MSNSFSGHPLLSSLHEQGPLGLISDFDGTLSPIVRKPEDAALSGPNLKLIGELRELLPLIALVSGRMVEDLSEKVQLSGITYIGNHGMERLIKGQAILAPEAQAAREALLEGKRFFESLDVPGLSIEDKIATITLHYRRTPDPEEFVSAHRAQIEELANRLNLRCTEGMMIFELRPHHDIHKGSAFRDLVEEHSLSAAVYLGDDTTDADALRMAKSLRETGTCHCVGIGVISEEMPGSICESADLLVDGVEGVQAFLQWLIQQLRART